MSKLLSLDDLIKFYSTKKRSVKFDANKSGEPIVVQVNGTMKFDKEKDFAEGLTSVRLQACHTDQNLNKSSISFETMKNKMLPTFKNRPILGYIHYVDGQPHFYDHRMHIEENADGEEEIVYDEIAVGIIPETNNAELVYDEEAEHYNVMVDGYIFNEYTKAPEILEREQECCVSVEIAISSMSWDAKANVLNIEDGYFSGVTILGVDENGNKVKPGMAKSNIKLKDFSESNNSVFSSITDEDKEKLIEMQTTINEIVERFNINNQANAEDENYGKEDIEVENNEEVKVEEEVTEVEETEVAETESTEEVTETNAETESEETVEDTPEVVENEEVVEETETEIELESEEDVEEVKEVESTEETVETEAEEFSEEVVEMETVEKSFEVDGKKFSVSFEISHGEIEYGLYNLIEVFNEEDNEFYFIRDVYDDHFVMQGWCTGKIYGCKYTKEGDTVALDGGRYTLHEELLTDEEFETLNSMRANYSSIQTELNAYHEAEELADKATVFEDVAYSAYLETEEFKSLMSEETMKKFTKEELTEKADATLGKLVKASRTFAYEEKKEEKKPTMFAFGHMETKSNFLDSLLKEGK